MEQSRWRENHRLCEQTIKVRGSKYDFISRTSKGVVLSTALGDALGATIEKLSYEQIKEQYKRVESLETKWYKADAPVEVNLGRQRGYGTVTDDTLMTIALINVYNKEGPTFRHI